jgi:hypothetical protein
MAGRLIKGKEFREHLKTTTGLSTKVKAVNCTDAIVPAWASILVTIQLAPATKIVDGNIDDLNAALYEELLAKIDFSAYVNKSLL